MLTLGTPAPLNAVAYRIFDVRIGVDDGSSGAISMIYTVTYSDGSSDPLSSQELNAAAVEAFNSTAGSIKQKAYAALEAQFALSGTVS